MQWSVLVLKGQERETFKRRLIPACTKRSWPFAILFFHSVSSLLDHFQTRYLTKTAGHVAFFSFMAELKDPKDYPKSLCLLQGIDLVLYIVASVVIYCYAGQDVTSPALGSASPIVRKVAYGIALPTVSAQ